MSSRKRRQETKAKLKAMPGVTLQELIDKGYLKPDCMLNDEGLVVQKDIDPADFREKDDEVNEEE